MLTEDDDNIKKAKEEAEKKLEEMKKYEEEIKILLQKIEGQDK